MSDAEAEVLARFRSARPRVTWPIWLIFVGANVGDVLWRGRDAGGLLVVLVLLAMSLLVWQLDVRPQVVAHLDRLVVRGGYRDVDVPWREVTDLERGPALVVHAGDRAVRCPSVSARLGDFLRTTRPRPASVVPGGRPDEPRRSVVDFAADELEALRARYRAQSATGPVVVTWRWPELALLGVVLLAILVVVLVVV